ncbi:MAG: hypothetical protein ACYTGQ_20190, partial [Planctomycetota bacterium]
MTARKLLSGVLVSMVCVSVVAQEWPKIEHRVPPPGMKVDTAVMDALNAKAVDIERRAEALRDKVDDALLVDVEVFAKALRWAVDFTEFWERKGYGPEAAGP